MLSKLRFPLITALLALMSGGWAHAASPNPDVQKEASAEKDANKEAQKYVRLAEDDDKKPTALQTAIVRFAPAGEQNQGVQVDLIGAIHIGDKAYYDELNQRFRKYEAVLYELVAREDANVPQPGQGTGSVVGGMQVGMKSLLGLEYQLDGIDYARKNLVHADMSPEEFEATMKSRNESFAGMFFRMLGRAMAEQANDPVGTGDFQLLAALFAKDRAHRLKLVMARQFADLEGEISMFDGPEGSTIITERNKKAFAVLSREIAKGRKKIAVFYGAGHLPDMKRRLEQDFGMRETGTDWVTAWSLAPSADSSAQPERK